MKNVRPSSETEYDDQNDNKLDEALKAAMARQACPDTMRLADFQAGWLAQPEQATIEAHVTRCDDCQMALTRLGQFMAAEAPVAEPISTLGWQVGRGFEWQLREAGRTIVRFINEALSPSPQFAAIATKGQTGQDDPAILRQIIVTPDDVADLDLQVIVRKAVGDDQTCLVQIRAEIPSQWPDLGGTWVQAKAGNWQAKGQTDEDGHLSFNSLPQTLVDQLVVEVGASAEES